MAQAPVPQDEKYALAFETSSSEVSVALGRGGDVLETRAFEGPKMHASDLLPTLDALCKARGIQPVDIGRVFVSAGPGSFTGLRIGITAARMIALAGAARILGVPSLEVAAQNALEAPDPPRHVAVIIDAKRGRVFAGAFVLSGDAYLPVCEPVEAEPRVFLTELPRPAGILGEGVSRHRDSVDAAGLAVLPETLWAPRADVVYRMGRARAARGESDDPRSLVPVYLRPPEAAEKWEQRQRDRGGG
jgi:tRNA threonylcarbamoyladenosine biosynthesis protein TsaB